MFHSFDKKKITEEVKEKRIPYIPHKLDLNHLNANKKLFSDDEIKKIKVISQNKFRFPSLQCNYQLRIIKFNDSPTLYAIYLGQEASLGYGTFGTVKLMQNLTTGEWCAVKNNKNLGSTEQSILTNEIKHLKLMGRFIGNLHYKKEYGRRDLIGMRLAPGISLFEFSQKNKNLSSINWLRIAKNIIEAVLQFHEKDILHCDIKPNNMIINPDTLDVTLIDLGASLPKKDAKEKINLTTDPYKAPELTDSYRISSSYTYTVKTDIYAVGRTIAQVLKLIVLKVEHDKSWVWIVNNIYELGHLKNRALHDEVWDYLLDNLMNDIPKKRIKLEDALKFFNKKINEFKKQRDYAKKIGIIDIKNWQINENDSQTFYEELQSMDKVWFIDKNNTEEQHYLRLQKKLQENNIKSGNKIFYGNHSSITEEKIFSKIKNPTKNDHRKFYFFSFTEIPEKKQKMLKKLRFNLYTAPTSTVDEPHHSPKQKHK